MPYSVSGPNKKNKNKKQSGTRYLTRLQTHIIHYVINILIHLHKTCDNKRYMVRVCLRSFADKSMSRRLTHAIYEIDDDVDRNWTIQMSAGLGSNNHNHRAKLSPIMYGISRVSIHLTDISQLDVKHKP